MLQLTNSNGGGAKTARRGLKSGKRADRSVKHPAFKALVAFNIVGAMVAAYLYFNREQELNSMPAAQEQVIPANDGRRMSRQVGATPSTPVQNKVQAEEPLQNDEPVNDGNTINTLPETTPISAPELTVKNTPVRAKENINVTTVPEKPVTKQRPLPQPETNALAGKETISYTVTVRQVYFHNEPDESTRRNAFINRWNKAVLKPLDEKNGFVYIVYTNQWGQTSKGWMLKKHLTPID